jgi:hypothetical protein
MKAFVSLHRVTYVAALTLIFSTACFDSDEKTTPEEEEEDNTGSENDSDGGTKNDKDGGDREDKEFMPLHQNLWVNSGSGRFPRV